MKNASVCRRVSMVLLLCAASAISSSAQNFTTLFSFDGENGNEPASQLTQGLNGQLFGTTYDGGRGPFGNYGDGTIFDTTNVGFVTSLYSFCSRSKCDDGGYPSSEVILATDGNLYGTTRYGGDHSGGTVFAFSVKGRLTTIYSFCALANCADGANPYAGLTQASDGNFYGTTLTGGANVLCGNPPIGCGTVFKLTRTGQLTTIYNFCSQTNCVDGGFPRVGLIQATDGNLYGTTEAGGTSTSCLQGCGTVFRITTTGTMKTLYSFCSQPNCTDGNSPFGALVQGADGNLYGTTSIGGNPECSAPAGCGTVFEISLGGLLRTLYSFGSGDDDGNFPYAGLVQAADSNFYGTTYQGGTHDGGTVFSINETGSLTTLYNFCSDNFFYCSDGEWPVTALLQATDGNLYGTTEVGGNSNDGTVFSISTGLAPFVKSVPAAARVGAKVGILGTDLTGASQVTFNGTVAQFTVQSATLIVTSVPAGATTGTVKVTLPGGTLTSNVPFHVLN